MASITLLDANPAQWPFVRFRVDFDEAVSGFGIEDVAPVLGGGAADAMILDVSFAAGHYEVLVYTGLADGTVGLEVLAGASVADAAGNPLAAGLVGPSSYQLDSSLLIPLFRNGVE